MRKRVSYIMIVLVVLLSVLIAFLCKQDSVEEQKDIVDVNKYVGALLEYQHAETRFECILSKFDINYFNSLELEHCEANGLPTDDWIFRITVTSEMLYPDEPIIRGINIIPEDANTVEILIFENIIVVGEDSYYLERPIIDVLKNKFIPE